MRERSNHASYFTSPVVYDAIKTTKNASDKEVVKHQIVQQEGKETEPTQQSSRRRNAPDRYTGGTSGTFIAKEIKVFGI